MQINLEAQELAVLKDVSPQTAGARLESNGMTLDCPSQESLRAMLDRVSSARKDYLKEEDKLGPVFQSNQDRHDDVGSRISATYTLEKKLKAHWRPQLVFVSGSNRFLRDSATVVAAGRRLSRSAAQPPQQGELVVTHEATGATKRVALVRQLPNGDVEVHF